FQIEDWASSYTVPLGLTNNATVFGNMQMIVFLVNTHVSSFTVWWNGSAQAVQTPLAYDSSYFKSDNPGNNFLSNGQLSLQFGGSSGFTLTSTVVGTSTSSTTNFMQINNQGSEYGSGVDYVVYNGVVRDIVQQEAEFGGGVTNCPNLYADIVLTLPANATYYTYQLSLMFMTSQQTRTITNLCPIQLSSTVGTLQTENGTADGEPIAASGTQTFSSIATWVHHWSQFITGSGSNTQGAGIMFTDQANHMLYCFDNPPTTHTGALEANAATSSISLLPVTLSQVSFENALCVTWDGAVVTFAGSDPPIYSGNNQPGLWILVEMPPTIALGVGNASPVNSGSAASFVVSGFTNQVNAGSAGSVTVTAKDAYGNTATGYTGTVKITSSDSQATLPANAKLTNGIGTFSVTLKTAGSQSITATDTVTSTITGSQTGITVNPTGATKLVFTAGTSQSLTAGTVSPTAIVIQRQDQYGNAVSSGTSQITVTLTTSSSGGTYYSNSQGTTTITSIVIAAGSSSSAGFYYKDTVAATPTLTGASSGLTSATNQFTINPGALQQFTFGSIGTQTTGVAFSISITAKDLYSNTITSYGSSVGLTASTGTGTISPTSTGTSGWSNGVWTGSVTLSTAGSVTITANDGSGHTGTSSAFTVNVPVVPPQLDVSNPASTAGASSYTDSLTTTKSNDLLYVAVSTGSHDTAALSGGGLTWTQRDSVAISGSRTLQTFWAVKTTSGAITITITLSGSAASSAVASAISGANTASPFDVTTPSTNTGTTNTASATISTTNPDFIIGAVGVRNEPISLTTGTGFTSIGSVTSVDPEVGAEYKTVTTAQTNLGVSYTLQSSNNWAIIVDAIKGV
ncbi:MAG: hypothetical protein ABSF65_09265, partial [Candidatus Bathyarchaeia archaeon]